MFNIFIYMYYIILNLLQRVINRKNKKILFIIVGLLTVISCCLPNAVIFNRWIVLVLIRFRMLRLKLCLRFRNRLKNFYVLLEY
jgi:hypothetical protein